jgi:hypothetical protein
LALFAATLNDRSQLVTGVDLTDMALTSWRCAEAGVGEACRAVGLDGGDVAGVEAIDRGYALERVGGG